MTEKIVSNFIEDQNHDKIAITSDGSNPLTYAELKGLIHRISKQLAGYGISNSDRAAIVLPNGPYMATSFLAISSYMSAAPLNPNYKSEEFEFYLKDLKPKIVLVEKNSENVVTEVAKKLGIPVCELKNSESNLAGDFNLFDKSAEYNLPNEDPRSFGSSHI